MNTCEITGDLATCLWLGLERDRAGEGRWVGRVQTQEILEKLDWRQGERDCGCCAADKL